jgi:hypothetical protein
LASRKASGSAIGGTIGGPRDIERFGRRLGSVANAPFENRQVTLDQEADAVVAEMITLGAKFEIVRTGADDPRWYYEAKPSMREPLRRYKATVELTKPGMQTAMVRAILRTKFVGAP